MQLIGHFNDKLVRVELWAVLQVPLSDVSGTLSENGQPGWCIVGVHGKIELHDVGGVLTILYAVVSDDVGDRAAVDRKQLRPEHRPFWDTHVESGSL